MTEPYQYKAFISYSHSDKVAGNRLLKRLEAYRVPRRLVGKPAGRSTGAPPVPRRIGKLFRDREELAAAESLTAEVKRALAHSEYMIVLCSPAAAASRWVNREIIEFKKLTGERRILSVILSGEPFASDHGKPDLECFPPALRFKLGKNLQLTKTPAEPLAADFRPQGDGRRRGTLKLVAGLLDIGLDALIERDLQRKFRRVTILTAASLVTALGMSGLTYEAVTARREAEENREQAIAAHAEAEHHRGEAEGLIDFMLTDLRDKLEPVGRLDVLDVVGEKAVNYYDRQKLEDMPSDALGQRARAFHLMGEIRNLQGNRDNAQTMFDEAAQATEKLLARDPENTQRIFEHAQSVYWVGYMDWLRGNYNKAEKAFKDYKTLADRLIKFDPSSFPWQMEIVHSNSNLGTVYLVQKKQLQKAKEAFTAAIEGFPKLSQHKAGKVSDYIKFGDLHAWMAEISKALGDFEKAIEYRLFEIKIYEDLLAADAGNTTARIQRSNAEVAYALLELDKGNIDKAIPVMREAIDTIQNQLSAYLSSCTKAPCEQMRWREYIGIHQLELTDVLMEIGDLQSASFELKKAQAQIEKFEEKKQDSKKYLVQLIYRSHFLIAYAAFKKGDYQKARKALKNLRVQMNEEVGTLMLVEGGPYIYARVLLLSHALLKEDGLVDAANKSITRIVDTLAPFETSLTPRARFQLAQAFSWAGNLEKAENIKQLLSSSGYAHPSFIRFFNLQNHQ